MTFKKYLLEMRSTLKSYRIREARRAKENKILLAQNKLLFGFIPIYGLQSRIHGTSSNDVCTDILQLHIKLREDDRYNFHYKLNFEKWEVYLKIFGLGATYTY